jgi:hypothetical protein
LDVRALHASEKRKRAKMLPIPTTYTVAVKK